LKEDAPALLHTLHTYMPGRITCTTSGLHVVRAGTHASETYANSVGWRRESSTLSPSAESLVWSREEVL